MRGILFSQFILALTLPIFTSAAHSSTDASRQLQQISYRIDRIEFSHGKDKSAELHYWRNQLYGIRQSHKVLPQAKVKIQELELRINNLIREIEGPANNRLRKQSKHEKTPNVPQSPGNDNCASAYVVGSGTYVGHTTFATEDGWATCSDSTSPDVWFRYVAPETATVVFSMVGSDYSPALSIHNPLINGCPGDPSDQIVCDDNFPGPKIVLPVNAGNEYLVRVSGNTVEDVGNYVLTIQKAGFISGRITNAFTQAPAAGINVYFFDETGDFEDSTTTNVNGEYISPALPSGTFYVQTGNFDELVDELYDNISCYQSNCDPTSGTPVVVNENTVNGVDFALNPTGSISGQITNSYDSDPVSNVQVRIYNEDGDHVETTFTDASGNYLVTGLDQGNYFIETNNFDNFIDELYDNISCPSFCNPINGTPIPVTHGVTTTGINFILDFGGFITGTIRDSESLAPIEAIQVLVYDSENNVVAEGVSAGNGFYFAEGLPSGTYYVKTVSMDYLDKLYDNIPCDDFQCNPLTGTPVPVAVNTVTPNIDFDLAPSGSVSGNITNANGIPLDNVFITVRDSDGNFVNGGDTDDVGHYRVSGLDAGNYFVQTSSNYADEVFDDIPCEGDCDPTIGDSVAVTTSNETTGIDFQLLEGGKITGTVKDEVTQVPIQLLHVYVYDSLGNFRGGDSTDFAGHYTISGLQEDADFFLITDSNTAYRNEIYDDLPCLTDFCDPTTGTPVHVSPGATTTGVDFELIPAGKVTGTIKDAISGEPLDRILVELYDSNGQFVNYRYTDPSGFYLIHTVLSGDYYVVAHPDEKYLVELYDGVRCLSSGCDFALGTLVPITLGGTTSGIDFNLDIGGSISGQVLDDSTGLPIYGVDVEIYDSNGNFQMDTFTDENGMYSTDSIITTGNYFVRVFTYFEGYFAEVFDNHPCNQCDVTTGDPVSVTEGTTTTNIDFGLDRPAVSISDASIVEGNSGTQQLTFTVTLSNVPSQDVIIDYQDDDGTAHAGFDFQPVSGQVVIESPNNSATITVPIYGDTDQEADETFSIKVTSVLYASILDGEGIGTIVNDDSASSCQFGDDFEDGTIDPLKWTILKNAFTEQSGQLIGTPVKRKAQAIATGFSGCGSDCSLNTTMQSAGGVGSKVVALAWYVDKSNKLEFIMNQDSGKWILKQRANGKVVAKQKAISIIMPDTTYAVAILFDGNQFQVQIDGATIITMNKAAGSTPFGTFGYEVKNTTGRFTSICVN